jgi:hypothetical protein
MESLWHGIKTTLTRFFSAVGKTFDVFMAPKFIYHNITDIMNVCLKYLWKNHIPGLIPLHFTLFHLGGSCSAIFYTYYPAMHLYPYGLM